MILKWVCTKQHCVVPGVSPTLSLWPVVPEPSADMDENQSYLFSVRSCANLKHSKGWLSRRATGGLPLGTELCGVWQRACFPCRILTSFVLARAIHARKTLASDDPPADFSHP